MSRLEVVVNFKTKLISISYFTILQLSAIVVTILPFLSVWL